MTLSSQVVSLELAQKLNELGVKQESLYYWHESYRGSPMSLVTEAQCAVDAIRNQTDSERISAFTVAELGEMLPGRSKRFDTINCALRLDQTIGSMHRVFYFDEDKGVFTGILHEEYGDTEADARAKMLIYLIEQKLITV